MKMEESIMWYFKTQRIAENGHTAPRFAIDLFKKNRISSLENELSNKDVIIDYLSKQLVFSTENNSNINNTSVKIEVVASNKGNVSKTLTCPGNSRINWIQQKQVFRKLEEKAFSCGWLFYVEQYLWTWTF